MPKRQEHYYVYDASDIHPDSIVIEMFDYEECYRDDDVPVLYLCRDCDSAARMLEEAVIFQEETSHVKKMERASDFFFQVQRTRLTSLEPLNSARKWETFRKIVDAYNLGEAGDCCLLNDYIVNKSVLMLETLRVEGRSEDAGRFHLPGKEKQVAELLNRYNKKVLSTRL